MGLNWLITGGCGFIGRNLIAELCESGENIRVLDNLSVGSRKDLATVCDYRERNLGDIDHAPSGVELVVGDIKDANHANATGIGIDIIVHLAANTGVGPSVEDPMSDCMSNVIGTVNMLESARVNKVSKFVFASSGAPAGEVDPPIHENIVPKPVSPYGASKLAGEGYCSAYYRCFSIETVCLRFGNVYGPLSANKESVVAKFIKRIANNEDLEVYGDGNQTRDYVYIADLVSAIKKSAATSGIGGEVFQIATSKETTLNELVDQISVAVAEHGMSMTTAKNSEARIGDVMRNFSDTTKAKEVLNWQADTSLKDGLSLTVKYFKDNLGK